MVFQHLALFPMMTVAENIGYGLRRRGVRREEINRRVAEVLARIGLPQAGPKRIDQLSGGQKQRVAIARCIVLDPAVLLLDEPLGALDLKLREHMKLELKQLQSQFGTTFVYITHDQSEALVMSDQVAVMNGGRFEQIAAPQELYYRPATSFVAGFVGDSHRWIGKIAARDANRLKIVTDRGLELNAFAAGGDGRSTPGDAIDVFVRPEAISLLPAQQGTVSSANGDNIFAGVLESVLFNGANSRGMVRLSSGDLIGAALQQPGMQAPEASFAEGAQVAIAFAASQTIGFPATGGPA
jgi:spermidine/putrescine transport system ATP-binding protein